MDTALLLALIKNGVKDKFFLEDKNNFLALSEDLKKIGYLPGDIQFDEERNIYEMDVYEKQGKEILLRVGREILATTDYKRMLRGYEKISDFNKPPFSICSKLSESEEKREYSFDSTDSLFEFILLEAKKGITVQRYKGLGEMNADQLWETTMNPEKRIMLQVSIDDAEKADDIFTLLMGEEVEPRRNFIQKHALEVSSLDY